MGLVSTPSAAEDIRWSTDGLRKTTKLRARGDDVLTARERQIIVALSQSV